MVTLHEVITFLVSMQISISSLQTHNVNRCGRSRHLARKLSLRRKRSSPNVFEMAATETITSIILIKLIRVSLGTVRHPRRFKIVVIDIQITLKQMLRDFIGIRVNRAKKSGMVNITSSVNSRERSGINTILHELNPLFTINVTMRDIKSKNVYSRVNSKATTQWRKTESANGVHLEGVASDNRSSRNGNKTTNLTSKEAKMGKVMRHTLGASLNIRHNLSSSKGPKPLQLKLLTTYIPKTSAFTLAFSTSQRLPEHGTMFTLALVRFPTTATKEIQYLNAKGALTYTDIAGDPVLYGNLPPREISMKDVFRSGDSSKKFKIAEGQWYRYAPSYVSPAYHLLEGFPFIQEPPSGDLQERVLIRYHDYDQCFQSVQLLQWNSQVKFNVTVYRNLPTTRDSIMTS